METDGLPKDLYDRRIEQALRRDFETSAIVSTGLGYRLKFCQGADTWASELVEADSTMPKLIIDVQ